MLEQEESMYVCQECGEEFESLTENNGCPHCGQKYVFPPVEKDDIEVLTPDGNSETYDSVEEAINAEGGDIGDDTDYEKKQDDLDDVIAQDKEEQDEGHQSKLIWSEEGLNEEFEKN